MQVKYQGKALLLFLQFALLSCAKYINMYSRQESYYCDVTSGLDGSNCAMYVISCSNVAGGIPLGIVVTSSETEWAFYNNGKQGPDIFMTDNASALREAIAA